MAAPEPMTDEFALEFAVRKLFAAPDPAQEIAALYRQMADKMLAAGHSPAEIGRAVDVLADLLTAAAWRQVAAGYNCAGSA